MEKEEESLKKAIKDLNERSFEGKKDINRLEKKEYKLILKKDTEIIAIAMESNIAMGNVVRVMLPKDIVLVVFEK